ncbi:MAG TPA: zinc-binding dehydrogenase [Acidimicrobiia bacterium]
MLALVAAPGRPGNVELREVAEPEPGAHEALVAVRAVSLNRGEVRTLSTAADGWRPGWDVAGEVVTAAADGTGPAAGERAVGLVFGGGWAERVAVNTSVLVPIPDALSFPAAATLPVAGLTAHTALGIGGVIDGRRVLVTGAAGGVGRFAVQLAAHGGAKVTAVVGSRERGEGLAELGATDVVVGMPTDGGFDLVLDAVGGGTLGTALRLLAADGTVVSYGTASGEPTTFDASVFREKGGSTLYGLQLAHELAKTGAAVRDLAYLAGLTATRRLDPQISVVADWSEAAGVTRALLDRQVRGKAVLLTGGEP